MAGQEMNLDLKPKWVEAIPLNGVKDTHERLTTRQALIGHEDNVDRAVMLDQGLLCVAGQLLEVNSKQLVVVERRHNTSSAIFTGRKRRSRRNSQREHNRK